MPRFVIECSENVLWMKTPADIMSVVYRAAEAGILDYNYNPNLFILLS